MSLVAERSTKRSDGGRRCVSRSVEVLQLLLPGLGAEVEDIAGGMAADAHDDVAEVVEGVDSVQLAGGEQRVEDAGAFGTVVASREEPVLATYDAPWQIRLSDLDSDTVRAAIARPTFERSSVRGSSRHTYARDSGHLKR